MKFNDLNIIVDGVTTVYAPYDRGTNGAFVWRKNGSNLNAQRVIASATTNDAASDKYNVQVNTPIVCEPVDCGSLPVVVGTDITKTEFRFLASTPLADRVTAIDMHIAVLEEFKAAVANREKIYA